MSGAAFTFSADTTVALAGLSAIAAVAGSPRAALDEIGAAMESSTLERFLNQEAPDGSAWEPSAAAEAEGRLTLVDTTRLRDSNNYQLDGDQAVEIGNNVVYGGIYQRGGEITFRWGHIDVTARPYLGVSSDDEAEIQEIVGRHLVEAGNAFAHAFGGGR